MTGLCYARRQGKNREAPGQEQGGAKTGETSGETNSPVKAHNQRGFLKLRAGQFNSVG
jgi:hypothetical protein